jgi:hypothetical protein
MVRRPILILALACVMLMALVGQAFAGGVVVTLDQMPTGVRPEQPFDVGFSIISAHTSEPIAGQKPVVEAVNPQTKAVIRQVGRPDGPSGHYVATLTLPIEGRWEWSIQPFTDAQGYPASELTPIEVQGTAAVSAPAPADAALAPQPPRVGTLPAEQVAGALALLALAGVTFALRGRLRPVRQ